MYTRTLQSPPMEHFWPGTNIRKSDGNAFTHGYLGRPHGFVAGQVPARSTTPKKKAAGGFAVNSGTIIGLGRKPNAPMIHGRMAA